MHSATLYRYNEEGRRDESTPIACITIDDNAMVEIRMQDGTVLYSSSLEQVGYFLMWDLYPVSSPWGVGVRYRRVHR